MKRLTNLVAVFTVAFLSSTLYAGAVSERTVTIDYDVDENGVTLDSGAVAGSMWTARSSSNDVERIGCSYKAVERDDGNVFKYGWCMARDLNEVTILCYTYNPEMLDAMQAISAFSFLRFEFTERDENNERSCTRFDISTQSIYLPEFTTKGNQ